MLRFFLGKFAEISALSDKKRNTVKLVGTYNLNSNILDLKATDISTQIRFNSSVNILESFKNNDLLLKRIELVFGDYALFASDFSFNFVERTFEVNVKKVLVPYENSSFFS